ncbi:hypothetical protein [Polystyrenella longa]|uniref:hypothetical protein n=1 Tax=Polystyrenella longa TaxID=2528007 RepID=UPI0011A6FB3E|nr:hypothetical protein [Polystyrenella longa]
MINEEDVQRSQSADETTRHLVKSNRSLPLAIVIAMIFGLFTGLSWEDNEHLHAAPRDETPPKAFESGGARSAKTLQEIKEILVRMDGRLERIEKQMGGSR